MIRFFLLCLVSSLGCLAQPELAISNNHYVNVRVSDTALVGACKLGQRYFAGDALGGVFVSEDFENWRLISRLDPDGFESGSTVLRGFFWANNQMTAFGPGAVYHSSDGENWSHVPMTQNDEPMNLISMTYSGSIYLTGVSLSGIEGKIFTSKDGVIWTETAYNLETPDQIQVIEGRIFVVESEYVSHSLDGQFWQRVAVAPSNSFLRGLVWNGTRFLAFSGTDIWTSDTGLDGWQNIDYPGDFISTGGYFGGAFVFSGNNRIYTSRDGVNWGWVDDLLNYQTWRYYQESDGELLLSGTQGSLLRTTDPFKWKRPKGGGTGLFGKYQSVSWDGEQFWARDSDTLYSSPNGIDWYARPIPGNIRSAVGSNGSQWLVHTIDQIFLSNDGSSWELVWGERFQTFLGHKGRFAYGAGTHVLAHSGSDRVMTSPDGRDWNVVSMGLGLGAMTSVVSNGQTFVAIDDTTHAVAVSNDGEAWERVSLQDQPREVFWTGSTFVAVGENGMIATSQDGHQWQTRALGGEHYYLAITESDGVIYVVGGLGGTFGQAITALSRDQGLTWEFNTFAIPGELELQEVFVRDGRVFVTTSEDLNLYSDNLEDWFLSSEDDQLFDKVFDLGDEVLVLGYNFVAKGPSLDELGPYRYVPERFSDLAIGDGRLVASSFGGIWTSTDGNQWTHAMDADGSQGNAAYGNGTFVVTGHSASIFYSADGLNWTQADTDGIIGFGDVVWMGSRFVIAEMFSNNIWLSDNGVDWTHYDIEFNMSSPALYTNGELLILDRFSGFHMVSEDQGLSWRVVNDEIGIFDMTPMGRYFFGRDSDENVWLSADAETWWPFPRVTHRDLHDLSVVDDQLAIHTEVGAMVVDLTLCPDTWWIQATSWPSGESVISLLQDPCLPVVK